MAPRVSRTAVRSPHLTGTDGQYDSGGKHRSTRDNCVKEFDAARFASKNPVVRLTVHCVKIHRSK